MPLRFFLLCGLLSPLVYALSDFTGAEGWLAMLLLGLFGWGVREASGTRRRLRIVGGLLIAVAVLTFDERWVIPALSSNDTPARVAAIILTAERMVVLVLVLAAMLAAGSTFEGRFHVYTMLSMAAVLLFAMWRLSLPPEAPVAQAVIIDGVSRYAAQLWYAALAFGLLQRMALEARPDPGTPGRCA